MDPTNASRRQIISEVLCWCHFLRFLSLSQLKNDSEKSIKIIIFRVPRPCKQLRIPSTQPLHGGVMPDHRSRDGDDA